MAKWQIAPAEPVEDSLKRIRDLKASPNARVRNQHVVSRIILRGFAVPGPNGKGWQLTPFDLQLGHEQRARGLAACGRVQDFLPYASESAEQLWNSTVENCLGPAIEAARDGHAHDKRAHVETVKDAIALHLVRSLRYRDVHRASVALSIENTRQTALISRRGILEAEFQRLHGLVPAGTEALAAVLEEPISRWRALDEEGVIMRARMEETFHRVRETLRPHEVEFWHVPPGSELLISDSPAVSFRYSEDHATVELNVAIGDASGIVLPLARDCLAVIGPKAKNEMLLPGMAALFNQLQVEVAHRHVYYRPGSQLQTFVQEHLPVKAT
jgi:hypothetical protein